MAAPIVALQLDAVGFVDEGIERVLGTLQERGSVNTLLVDSLWFSRGTTARELKGEKDRGHPPIDRASKLQGAVMGAVHPRFYRDAGVRAEDLTPDAAGRPDLLALLRPATKARGMRLWCTFKDGLPDKLPGAEKLLERDFNGQQAETTCKNNPYYRNLLMGVVEDLIRSYEVDGIMYMAERQGPFTDTLGMRFRGKQRGLPGARTCFCEFCRAKAASAGIRFERAKRGFEELERFVAAGRASRRPADGYYTTLWRLMLRYPELLAWEHLWHEGLREVYRLMYEKVKAVNPAVLFGSHMWPNHTMNPVLRAEEDVAQLTPYHDFLKLALYHNCGGPRIASYIESVGQTVWGDVPPDELLAFHYRVMNYDEAPYRDVWRTGLKRDFVYRESLRAMEGARGSRTLILPGIDIDIPLLKSDLGEKPAAQAARSTRQEMKAAVGQAFRAGAHGVVLSREYTEMNLENLAGAGDACRQLQAEHRLNACATGTESWHRHSACACPACNGSPRFARHSNRSTLALPL